MLTAAVAAAIAAGVVLAAAGGAQTPGARTLTFLDDTNHGTQALVDSAPKSPVRNPQSRRFRLSTGDTLYVRSPIGQTVQPREERSIAATTGPLRGGARRRLTWPGTHSETESTPASPPCAPGALVPVEERGRQNHPCG